MGAVLGVMGHMLEAAKQRSGGIPLIQSLVVLKNGPLAGLPDDGMDEFWSDYSSLTVSQKRKRVEAEYQRIAHYGRKWQQVLKSIRTPSGIRESSGASGGERRVRYWVMKGNPSNYDWEKNLVINRVEDWHADKVPEELKAGDRVFFWESGSKKRIVALGSVEDPFVKEDANGDVEFDVRYLTSLLRWMPDIALLRNIAELGGASFLKAGVHGTVYPLSDAEATARRLLRETTKSVITIANEIGYSNPSHFAQLFRKETGLSPTDYRRQG
jgi:predicted RNA-binding protein with PUA-like domain